MKSFLLQRKDTHIRMPFPNSFLKQKQEAPTMINKINNTTNKAKPPPQLLQLPPNPIIVPPLIRGENKGTLMYFNGFNLLYVFYAIIEQVLLK